MELDPAECANCGIKATMRCARCHMGAPDYRFGDSMAVVYCGRECQTKHWPDHKSHCHAMKRRRKLLRAANILQAAFLTYREILYDIDLTKVEAKDGTLCLYQNQRSITAPVKRGLFPNHLTTNIQHKEAALAINQCTTATALLGRLTQKLLAGVSSTIEVLDIRIGKPLLPPKLIPGRDLKDCPHTVIKVELLFTTESWIIDTTGCQYGFREVLVPFDKYIADKVCQLLGDPTTYNWTETKDLDYFSTLPSMNRSRAQKQDREVERKARLHFADFVDRCVDAGILDGSTSEFKNNLASFGDKLKTHMLSFANY
ncbi:uncharacterized protein BKA55DRAFT_529940 [Fusarium redolens]|uniref:MYND-type domain-containing protein n=1 Tax=Fusarium redolens TaxID=48865 RepID=A0A9P9FXD6_FUSRE|nr:uncharacterized protein BKA55DRAFT_529940 [Fusarium redolens]KAH7207876.1 hypothetical protein BKA55DRAFT_529940 [Fusarium redolens]